MQRLKFPVALGCLFLINACAYKLATQPDTTNTACTKTITKVLTINKNTELPEVCNNKALMDACLKILGFEDLSKTAMYSIMVVNNTVHLVRAFGCSID